MGYDCWTEINVVNNTDRQLCFQNATAEWGKFYSCENGSDKNDEISPAELNNKIIAPFKEYKIGSCGREQATSGCEGSFELWDKSAANVMVAKIGFDSPAGPSYNRFSIDCPAEGWSASQNGAYLGDDAKLGEITVTVTKY